MLRIPFLKLYFPVLEFFEFFCHLTVEFLIGSTGGQMGEFGGKVDRVKNLVKFSPNLCPRISSS